MDKNIKSLKRQLMAAVAMCLAAAVALGTSTYAWFASNKSVTAEGMQVSATTDDTLLQIKYGENGDFGTTASSTAEAQELKLCTSYDGVHFAKLGDDVVVPLEGESNAQWTGADNTLGEGDLVTIDTTEGYVSSTDFTLKNSADGNVYVKDIVVTNNSESSDSSKLLPCIRVAVKMGEGSTLVFKPDTSAANNNNKVGKYAQSAWSLVDDEDCYKTPDTEDASLGGIGENTNQEYVSEVSVSIWYEGQDTQAYTTNLESIGLKISVTFSTAFSEESGTT